MDQQPQPPERAVVGWDERPRDEKQAIRRRDLDAPDRHARRFAHFPYRAEPMETSVRLLALQLPRETEDRSIGSELHLVRWAAVTTLQHCPLGAERGAEPKTGDQLDVLSRERFLHGCEVASSEAVNVSIGVHQALKERLPLGDRRSEVELRN